MTIPCQRVPARAWVVTFAGTAVNLCLGILYAWSVWKDKLIAKTGSEEGSAMTGLDVGWTYLTPAQGTWAYAICGFVFAVSMIGGGRLQDKYGPRLGAISGGLFLASGCILAGLMKSFLGLILGFGILGGIGMGLGYAAATPAAVKWFGPHQRGLIVGLVVGGYGGAAIYISPLARWLMDNYGISGSFIGLGVLFAVVVIVAGQLLSWPDAGYVPPGGNVKPQAALTRADWSAPSMLRTWQFYALVFLFIGSAQSGLLVIANATRMLKDTALLYNTTETLPFLAVNAWILSSFGGLVNTCGRIGTGLYSDQIGRANAYMINGIIAAACLLLTPIIMQSGQAVLLFLVVGIVYWQYGGGLSLLPAFTADYFGSKNLGFNYGLVFIGWGIAFFLPQLAGYIEKMTGSTESYVRLAPAFYISGGILVAAVILSRLMQRPLMPGENEPQMNTDERR